MAERRTRRRFTAELKAEAVQRLLEGGRGLSEVATELGLSPGQLSSWRTEHLAAGSAEALAARNEPLPAHLPAGHGTAGEPRPEKVMGARDPVLGAQLAQHILRLQLDHF